MPFTAGLSALIRLGAALELDAENEGRSMEAISIGSENSQGTYALEIAGRHLCYTVTLCGEQARVFAVLLDSPTEPDLLLKVKDTETEWNTVFRFISSLEKYEVKSLERPIMSGPVGEPDAWIVS
jgi:hypothetical protein